MQKRLFTAVFVLTALLASFTKASNQKSVIVQKRYASQKKGVLSNRQPLDKSAVKWDCEQNKAFWLSGDFRSDPALTLYWSGRNYILPRVPTTTGAKRFKDPDSGLDLIVLPFKAMLFSDHGARARLVDECKTVEMQAAASLNPAPMRLLFAEESATDAAEQAPFSAPASLSESTDPQTSNTPAPTFNPVITP